MFGVFSVFFDELEMKGVGVNRNCCKLQGVNGSPREDTESPKAGGSPGLSPVSRRANGMM